ncbi:hypothetical protein M2155_000616 [Streptomyces sp. SAI-119]|uniref:DUF6197 family protein n=1 Tax=Streptomyces sp. SAI-119 TaxID=2940541 RepID=UPI00247666D7|nr:hypothetical protein [Streptomyces sp. SAI-119]MDH6448208.1 hypothetical protein [Streptomyces sp. SAI-119]
MTTTILAPASPPPVLDLEARLALADAAMNVRLDDASAQFAIRTAHIDIDPASETAATVPLTPTLPPPTASPYSTPMADLLHRAHGYIATRGLLRGGLRDENDVEGARCPIGALRYEAGANRWLADDACALLLDVIQAEFADAYTIPSWVDGQTSAAPVLACMSRAAELAHTRQL